MCSPCDRSCGNKNRFLPACCKSYYTITVATRVKVTLNKGYNEEEGRVAEFAERDMTTGLHQFSVYKSEVCVAQTVPDV